ncbi:drug resistance transporter, EmrB/QacA subfamily [Paenibacillus curdlanolyticus YK9]|uniref:Drug resistance transporter, EmrB/QacA subfamily n=1 Tax=Paenibacillus curdlanolyticus YK9 TaxID=717606 RepID=E0IB81_9BACL|nr:MDR family MFS transporter [Paenibacillus curdlanolyticus]EFM10372.1 drug resistance transporter, EmrB/QacA subfamily [Paenibacillus curdlanolyticus YK9]
MLATQSNRLGFVVAGLLLGIFVAAIDNTIVATAMATIVSDLGGMEKFVWVTSAYLVTEMAAMPIFGKLSDMYGRKRFFMLGIGLFLLGSILCGTAHSIVELSIYRAIQGIGGGALVPIAFTIVFDVFPPEKRGKMGGLFGAVFGTSSLFGPLLGAYLTDHIHWRWIFYINLPLGLIALALVYLFYRESMEHSKQQIDWWGATTLVGSIVCLMFALELGGQEYAWDSTAIIGLFSISAALMAVFLYVETKAKEPIISYDMFRKRLFAASTVIGLLYGAGFITFAMYIPIYIQGVTGGTATQSGLFLLPMTLGSVVAAQLGGMSVGRTSYRNVMLFSAVIFIIGTLLLGTITPDTPSFLLTIYLIIAGLGVGFSFSVLGMSAIHHFDVRQRGSANSTMAFLRSLGMTVGLTVFGILQRNLLKDDLSSVFSGGGAPRAGTDQFGDVRQLLSPENRAQIPTDVMDKIVDALSSSISTMFLWAIIPAGLSLVAVFFMGNDRLIIPSRGQAGKAQQEASVSSQKR